MPKETDCDYAKRDCNYAKRVCVIPNEDVLIQKVALLCKKRLQSFQKGHISTKGVYYAKREKEVSLRQKRLHYAKRGFIMPKEVVLCTKRLHYTKRVFIMPKEAVLSKNRMYYATRDFIV